MTRVCRENAAATLHNLVGRTCSIARVLEINRYQRSSIMNYFEGSNEPSPIYWNIDFGTQVRDLAVMMHEAMSN